MGANTKIEWCDFTFNPWRGCQKVAAGCVNCYAESQSKRNPKTLGVWGPNGTRVVASESMWRQPLGWNKVQHCYPQSPTPRVFCGSLCDVFEDWPGRPTFAPEKIDGEEVSPVAWYGPVKTSAGIVDQVCRAGQMLGSGVGSSFHVWAERYRSATLEDVRARLFSLIDSTPSLDWLLLTKRPENVRKMWCVPTSTGVIGKVRVTSTGPAFRRNVRLGASIACQEDADRNVPELLKCSDLCAKTFLSIEPLIDDIDIRKWLTWELDIDESRPPGHFTRRTTGIDWVVVGGESGPKARPCDIQWIRSIVRQCQEAGVPVFVKQLGARPTEYVVTAIGQDAYGNVDDDGRWEDRKLRDPKGGDPAEWPEDVRVREVPT